MRTANSRLVRLLVPLGLVALAATAGPAAAQSGDRQLLRTGSGNPYLMILFDTSGSMNYSTACSQADYDAGNCNYLCSTLNCPPPQFGDDPGSKLREAKWALYSVLKDVDNINLGFASLNQDTLAVGAKHWIYTVYEVDGTSPLPSGATLVPQVNWKSVFGPISGSAPPYNFGCDRSNPSTDDSSVSNDAEADCYANSTDAIKLDASPVDAWRLAKIQRLPKGGADGKSNLTVYAQTGSGTPDFWKIVYLGSTSGSGIDYANDSKFDLKVDIDECKTVSSSGSGKNKVFFCSVWKNSPTELTVRYTREVSSVPQDTSFLFNEGALRKNDTTLTNQTETAYFGGWEDGPAPSTYTSDGVADGSDTYATATCRGWEPSVPATGTYPCANGNCADADSYSGYDLRFPSTGKTFDPPDAPWNSSTYDYFLESGDVIPLDWNSTNKSAVLARLAPSGAVSSTPDVNDAGFGIASYFNDTPNSGESFLRLKSESQRPLVGYGSTPLAGWFSFFRYWYSGCGDPGNCTGTGWSDIAARYDPNWNCRKKFVLMITDGAETCDKQGGDDYYGTNSGLFPNGFSSSADQCRYRASLKSQEGVETLVLAFGAENHAKLQCANTDVVYADNKEELVTQIQAYIAHILETAASFASAAVPTVQANILDKVYLSSFVPLNGASIWPGRLDSFLKPLPIDPNTNLPDRSTECSFTSPFVLSQCWAWDAGDSQPAWNGEAGYSPRGFLNQTPLEADLARYDNSTLKLGDGVDQRRVYFGLPDNTDSTDYPGNRQLFGYPEAGKDVSNPSTPRLDQLNYEYAWNLPAPLGSDSNRSTVAGVVEFTLKQKQAEIDNLQDPSSPFHVQYVLGDIFHSNPIVVNPPEDFNYFTKNLYWGQALCGQSVADTETSRGPAISYQYWSDKNLCRRVMAFFGSDDGQLHAVDAGTFVADSGARNPGNAGKGPDCKLAAVPSTTPQTSGDLQGTTGVLGEYNFGTGRELFSFIPNAMMPVVKELSEASELTDQYGIDGSPRTADVFIDPNPPRDSSTGYLTPECTSREWRTVLLSNYREGAPGIFALDITQPDTLDASTDVPQPRAGDPSYVPSCSDGGTGCGPLPFPALKWEFRDLDTNGNPADDDVNGQTDLANSWSRPVVVRMQVCDGTCDAVNNPPEDRYVAVFGGGLSSSPNNSAADVTGDWLYMVDMETGRLLYKRGGEPGFSPIHHGIIGAVPADITAVDRTGDGLVDTLYFGTTAGYVYKVALGDGPFSTDDQGRIADPTGETGAYDPFEVFSTGGRPIYLEINAVYVPKYNTSALLFGTGNRWNLWQFSGVAGRFYALLDESWADANHDGVMDTMSPSCASCTYPLTDSNFSGIDPYATSADSSTSYLYGVNGQLPGWYFSLSSDEKLITEASTISGVSFFTIFSPTSVEVDNACAFGGESKIFIVNAVTTSGYAIAAGATTRTRYSTAPTFTTQPYVEQSATKNPARSDASTANSSDTWTTELSQINNDLKKLLGPSCRFANYSVDIKTIRSDTGLVFIAPVPVCFDPHDWRQF